MSTKNPVPVCMNVRAKFWSDGPVESLPVMVGPDAIRVWDAAAGYYTSLHSLGARAERRIRNLARVPKS